MHSKPCPTFTLVRQSVYLCLFVCFSLSLSLCFRASLYIFAHFTIWRNTFGAELQTPRRLPARLQLTSSRWVQPAPYCRNPARPALALYLPAIPGLCVPHCCLVAPQKRLQITVVVGEEKLKSLQEDASRQKQAFDAEVSRLTSALDSQTRYVAHASPSPVAPALSTAENTIDSHSIFRRESPLVDFGLLKTWPVIVSEMELLDAQQADRINSLQVQHL
jgi:hypothetical protein